MAVDNLPCELPRDSSEMFGEMFLKHVIPSFFNNDKDDILKNSQMTSEGELTPRFKYLSDYILNDYECFNCGQEIHKDDAKISEDICPDCLEGI